MKLIDIADVIRGTILSRYCSKDKGEQIRVLVAKSISEGLIRHDLLSTTYWAKGDESQKVLTKEGDIIIKISEPFDSSIVTKEDEELLVSSSTVLIRCRNKSDSPYLLAILNQKSTINRLTKNIIGTHMAILNVNTIKELEIPQLSSKTKNRIGELYVKNIKSIKTLNEIKDNQSKLVNEIIRKEMGE